MILIYIAICMTLVMYEVVPPKHWWQYFTYLVTWPTHMGIWIKDNLGNKDVTVNNFTINKE